MPLGTASTLRALALGMGGLAVLVAAIEFAEVAVREEAGPAAAADDPATDGPAGTLARCRTVAPDDEAALEGCRAAWEEARRRFFGLPPETAVGPVRPAGVE